MKRYQKILSGVVIALIIILGGVQIFVIFYLDEQLKETAVQRFHENTGEGYSLEIGDLDLWIIGRRLNIREIGLKKDEQSTGTTIHATVEQISLSGIGFLNLLLNKKLNLDEVELTNPNVHVASPGKKEQQKQNKGLKNLSRQFSKQSLKNLNSISVSELKINGLSADFKRADLPFDTLASIDNSDIIVHDILIDSASIQNEQIIPAENLYTTLRDIRHQTTNNLYNLTANKIEFNSSSQLLDVDSVKVKPKYDKQEFSRQITHEIDRLDIEVDQLTVKDLDTEQLNRGEGISSRHILLNKAIFDIYRDKRLPSPKGKNPPLPLDMLRNIPVHVSVDTISLQNSHIRYSERLEKAEEAGYIDFANLSATFCEVSNDEEKWRKGTYPTLHAEADVMGKALLSADFEFVPTDSSDHQFITGNLEPMDMQPLNEALVPLAFVRIEDGQILGLDFEMTLGENEAAGEVLLRYEDFKISLLNKEQNEETLGKKVLSLLVNNLKVKSANKGEDLRTGKVEFERDKNKATFNYWWKSLLSGLKSSIGL